MNIKTNKHSSIRNDIDSVELVQWVNGHKQSIGMGLKIKVWGRDGGLHEHSFAPGVLAKLNSRERALIAMDSLKK